MLRVNEKKLLCDHATLIDKRASNYEEIEAKANAYAISRNYDEEKRAKFVAYIRELEGDGLSAEDRLKLDLLESYIEEVEDPVEEPISEVADEPVVEPVSPVSVDAVTFTI